MVTHIAQLIVILSLIVCICKLGCILLDGLCEKLKRMNSERFINKVRDISGHELIDFTRYSDKQVNEMAESLSDEIRGNAKCEQ
ncbi:hypothetical protein Enr17x_59710 [Gimesia fumaroli]|uniref:Uncharacterized protein n=1 Tax=Gimesia fumaroli TaxID=2527976 RepID=A0A518ILB4_9PLAN|nr:hypothetical protein Enr17x_59710 [Gimesia fumaroli]